MYSVYRFGYRTVAKILRKQDKAIKKSNDWQALQLSYKKGTGNLARMLNSDIDYAILAFEKAWCEDGKQTIFIDSAETAQSLLKGKFTLDKLSADFMPYENFMIGMPSDLKLNNQHVQGALIHFSGGTGVSKASLNFLNYLGVDNRHDERDLAELTDENYSLTVSYTVKGENDTQIITLNQNTFPCFMAANNGTEYYHQIMKANDTYEHDQRNLNAYQTQYELLKLIISMSIYVKAKPSAITDGMPNRRLGFEGYVDKECNKKTIKTSNSRAYSEKSEHTRSWFIRQLINQRFYRGNYKDMKSGTRFVFIDETTVNLGENIENASKGS